GQPLIYQPTGGEAPGVVRLEPPLGPARQRSVSEWPFIHEDTREPGVYRLTTPAGKIVHYVVQPDPGETEDLSPCGAEDREQVAALLPVTYAIEPGEVLAGPAPTREVWWWLMLGVLGMLSGEVWLTRRIVKGR